MPSGSVRRNTPSLVTKGRNGVVQFGRVQMGKRHKLPQAFLKQRLPKSGNPLHIRLSIHYIHESYVWHRHSWMGLLHFLLFRTAFCCHMGRKPPQLPPEALADTHNEYARLRST